MVEIETLRSAVQTVLGSGTSADALAAQIGDVSGQTVLNFAQPGHRILGRTRKAFEDWYYRSPAIAAPLAPKPYEAGERVALSKVEVLERTLKEHRDQLRRLRSEVEARERVVELMLDALIDAALSEASPGGVGVPPSAGAGERAGLTPTASPERLEQRTADQSTPDTLADADRARARG